MPEPHWAGRITGTGSSGGGSSSGADTVVPASTRVLANKLAAGDTQPAWRVLGDGKQEWGPGGSGAPDANLYRLAAGYLQTDSNLLVGQALLLGAAADVSLSRPSGGTIRAACNFFDANNYLIAQQGKAEEVWLGYNGNTPIAGALFGSDTNLYRSAAGTLKSDGGLIASGGLVTKTKAGTPSDADLAAGMQQSGAIIVDTTASKIWVRVGTAWKSVTLA